MADLSLIERLRAYEDRRVTDRVLVNPDGPEAATAIEDLLEALNRALELGDQLADALTLRTHDTSHGSEEIYLSAWDKFSFLTRRTVCQRILGS